MKLFLLTTATFLLFQFGNSAYSNAVLKYKMVPPGDCAGAPAVSNTVSSTATACSGVNFTLSMDITYTDNGITYQWQSSTDGFSYSDIVGATADTLVINQAIATYYQCIVTCTISTMSTTSVPVLVNLNTPPVTVVLTSDDPDGIICPGTMVQFTGDGSHAYYDFQVNGFSVQAGVSNTYSTNGLNNNDQVTVLAGFDATCNTTSNVILITHHDVPVGTISPVDISCNGLTDGSMDLSVSGGTPGYTFLWSNSETTEDISGLSANTYSVVITDANGCTGNALAGIAEPTAINTTVNQINVSCFGMNDGSIDLTVSGGVGGYVFDWDIDGTGDFDDTEDLTNLSPGIYSGVLMDANGCTDGGTVTITEPDLLLVTATSTDISCNGMIDGSIDVIVTGGTALYVYDWDNDGTGDFDDTEDLSALSNGNYNLQVMDANGCTANASGTIIEPAVLSSSISSVDILCNGNNTGSIDLTVIGGTLPYTFDWDNDGTGDFDDSEDLNALTAGTYTVNVMDDHGCLVANGATLNEPTPISVTVSSVNPTCFSYNDGSIDITVSGGVGGYVFDWDNDGTGDFDDTEDLSNLVDGVYTGVVMDANGCTDGGSVTITEPAFLDVTRVLTQISCFGLTDAAINASVTGGTGAYLYDWNIDGTGDFDDVEDLSGLGAGTYTIVVMDANGCTDIITSIFTEPTLLQSSLTFVDILCNGDNTGSINLSVTGGTPPYQYDWDYDGTGDFNDPQDPTSRPAGTYNVVVRDNRGCTTPNTVTLSEPSAIVVNVVSSDISCYGLTDGFIDLTVSGGVGGYTFDWDIDGTGDFDDTEDLSGLSAGTYNGVLMDANGCTDGGSIIINEPDSLYLTLITNDITCNGFGDGIMDMTINGGTTPFSIDWDNDGTGDNDDTEDLSNLLSGNYFVTVTDNRGCSDTISGSIIEPAVLLLDLIYSDVSCTGYGNGQASVVASGGTLPYIVDWSNDGMGDNDDSLSLDSLTTATYQVIATDLNGCAVLDSTFFLYEPPALTISTQTTDAICDNIGNGSIDLTISGGTGTYNFLWSNNATTEDLTNVSAGIYFLVAYDANGCNIYGNDTVEATNVAPTVSLNLITDTACNTSTSVILDGGSPAGGNFSGSGVTGNIFNPSVTGAGTFVIIYTYTDTTGCFNTATDMISVDDCTGINEIEQAYFSLYPNPANNSITIHTLEPYGNLMMLDAVGKMVFSKEINASETNIDISNYESGIYLIILETSNGSFSQKLVKN